MYIKQKLFDLTIIISAIGSYKKIKFIFQANLGFFLIWYLGFRMSTTAMVPFCCPTATLCSLIKQQLFKASLRSTWNTWVYKIFICNQILFVWILVETSISNSRIHVKAEEFPTKPWFLNHTKCLSSESIYKEKKMNNKKQYGRSYFRG